MSSRIRRIIGCAGLFSVFALAVTIAVGCSGFSGFSPFAAAQFATTLSGLGQGGPQPPTNDNNTNGNDNTDGTLASVCDLAANLQGIAVTVQNGSTSFLQYSMTFVVSAGPGGFVCDDEILDYTNAGYRDILQPGQGNTVNIGCDTITLLSGTRILALDFGINQGDAATLPPATGDDPEANPTQLQLLRRDNGSPVIPLPEIIVLGNNNANFICIGGSTFGDLCTQRGFVYTSIAGFPVGKSANVSRIQGTVCNEGFGTAPEWRLDKTLNDGQVQAFQYAAGGAIIATALNRANDPIENNRVQVVWLVTNGNGDTIHFPEQ